MNIGRKNNHHEKKSEILEEPKVIYGTEEDSIVSSDSEIMNPILEKLISKSIQDAKEGKGISNEDMNQKIKLKYPFLK